MSHESLDDVWRRDNVLFEAEEVVVVVLERVFSDQVSGVDDAFSNVWEVGCFDGSKSFAGEGGEVRVCWRVVCDEGVVVGIGEAVESFSILVEAVSVEVCCWASD